MYFGYILRRSPVRALASAPHWYTILKYRKPVFLQDLSAPESKPQRRRFGVAVAVLLLVGSALTIPLVSYGAVATSAGPGPGTMPRVTVLVVQPPGQIHGNAVLDGVATVFVVAPPQSEGSNHADENGAPSNQPVAGGTGALVIVAEPAFGNGSIRIHETGFGLGSSPGQGFGPSGTWLPDGSAVRAGFMGEGMVVPSSVSSVTAAVPKIWWDFFQRRSKFEIYVEMLELMKSGPMTPFEVAFYARLNHKRTKEYAEFLADAGYLQPVTEEGRVLYALTNEGQGFLDRVQTLLVAPGIIEGASHEYQRDF